MDDRRVGRIVREVRIHRAWRQRDLGDRAGVSQGVVSLIERGRLEHVSLATLRAVGEALDIRISIDAWWRSGDGDRLLDRGHAALVDHVVTTLRACGWVALVEVTFNSFGDRGSADLVGWHAEERLLLIVEVKTRILDVQETLATFARKVRVLPPLLAGQEGWAAVSVARLIVVADTRGNRDIVRRHEATFESVVSERTVAVRRWLARPNASVRSDGTGTPSRRGFGGLWFVPPDTLGIAAARSIGRSRVRPKGARPPAPPVRSPMRSRVHS